MKKYTTKHYVITTVIALVVLHLATSHVGEFVYKEKGGAGAECVATVSFKRYYSVDEAEAFIARYDLQVSGCLAGKPLCTGSICVDRRGDALKEYLEYVNRSPKMLTGFTTITGGDSSGIDFKIYGLMLCGSREELDSMKKRLHPVISYSSVAYANNPLF